MVVGALRTWRTMPSNVLPGNASTVNVAFIAVREPADVGLADRGVDLHAREILGDREQHRRADSDAATVWPTSTARDSTTPSTGE